MFELESICRRMPVDRDSVQSWILGHKEVAVDRSSVPTWILGQKCVWEFNGLYMSMPSFTFGSVDTVKQNINIFYITQLSV